MALADGPILALVYTDEYAAQSAVFVRLTVSWGLRYPSAFLAGGLVAARRFSLVPWVFFPSFVAALASGAAPVPHHGILGAAWADMIAASLQVALTLLLGRRLFVRGAAE